MISKEKFIQVIYSIQKQLDYDNKCHDAFSVILKNDYVSGYDYSLVLNSLIELLKIEFNDDEDWIEYFIWELDFGKKYKDGMITNKNNEIIHLH